MAFGTQELNVRLCEWPCWYKLGVHLACCAEERSISKLNVLRDSIRALQKLPVGFRSFCSLARLRKMSCVQLQNLRRRLHEVEEMPQRHCQQWHRNASVEKSDVVICCAVWPVTTGSGSPPAHHLRTVVTSLTQDVWLQIVRLQVCCNSKPARSSDRMSGVEEVDVPAWICINEKSAWRSLSDSVICLPRTSGCGSESLSMLLVALIRSCWKCFLNHGAVIHIIEGHRGYHSVASSGLKTSENLWKPYSGKWECSILQRLSTLAGQDRLSDAWGCAEILQWLYKNGRQDARSTLNPNQEWNRQVAVITEHQREMLAAKFLWPVSSDLESRCQLTSMDWIWASTFVQGRPILPSSGQNSSQTFIE